MASDVVVPEVGELGMEVTFVRWLKSAGEEVAVGDPLFELDTEKSVMVVEAYAAGVLADLRVSEGDTVAPRDVIGRILAEGEAGSAAAADAGAAVQATAPEAPSRAEDASPAASTSAAHAVAAAGQRAGAGASPRARRIARELGVALEGIAGSGPEGLITEGDVRAAAERAAAGTPPTTQGGQPSASPPRRDPRERARRAVADLTTASWQTIPHFFVQLEADVGRGLALAKPTPLVCASVAQALVRHPECNLGWDGDMPVRRETVDLGLLVDAPAGLLIAVITDAQDLDLVEMADAVRAAAERARRGTLATSDMGPRSLTISNLGMYSVDRFTAVIPRPDILTLAVGRTRSAVRWVEGAPAPRTVVDLTLSVDHRALDGAAAARFLTTLEGILADPAAEGLA